MKSTGMRAIFAMAFFTLAIGARAQSPREQLQQLTTQLQSAPADIALRKRIIELAAQIKPPLAIPPEAKRPFVMAGTYQKEAKSPSDFALAIDAYQDALKIAPWWGDAYYNLSVTLESAGRLDEAKDALNLYLLTGPRDADEAQNRLYALEAKKTLATARQSAEVAAAKKRLLPSVEGKWTIGGMFEFQVVRSGDTFAITAEKRFGKYGAWRAGNAAVDQQHVRFVIEQFDCPQCRSTYDLSVSTSGNELTGTLRRPDGTLEPINGPSSITRLP
jgi:tetratricopeptide (TPR) repeat protein